MGVDASLYAKQAKTRLYFDRERNFLRVGMSDPRYNALVEHLQNNSACQFTVTDGHFTEIDPPTLSASEIRYIAEMNLSILGDNPDAMYAVGYNHQILRFLKRYPNDRFFVVNDQDFNVAVFFANKYKSIQVDRL